MDNTATTKQRRDCGFGIGSNSYHLLLPAWLKHPKTMAAIVALLAGMAFLPGVSGPFIYDDNTHIANNPKIHSPKSFSQPILNGKRQRRVLLNLSFGLNGMMSGTNPISYKLTNIFLHVCCTLLAFLWLRLLLNSDTLAFAISSLFAVHPLQVESVTYIMGRVSLLPTLFLIFSFYLLEKKRNLNLIWLFLLFCLSLLSKESAVLLPITWIAYEVLVHKKPWMYLTSLRALTMLTWPVLYLPLKSQLTQSEYWGRTVGFNLYPYWDHLLNQLFYYYYYLVLFISPQLQSISHPLRYLDVSLYIGALIGLLIIACSALAFFYCLKKNPLVSFFLFLFYSSLIITNGPIQMVNPFAEYRLYIANLVLCSGFVFLTLKVQAALGKPWLARASIGVAGLGFLICSMWLSDIWGNQYEIYRRSARLYPNYERNLTFAGIGCELEENYKCAAEYYEQAMDHIGSAKQKTVKSLFRLASVQFKSGQPEKTLRSLELIPTEKLRKVPSDFYKLKMSALTKLDRIEEAKALLETVKSNYPPGTFNSTQSD